MSSISRRDAKKMVGPGWAKILDKLYDIKPRSVYVMQVKEKYGGLRFYIGSASQEFFDAIDAAEHESYLTCEQCGEPGELRGDLGWVLTLCNKHYQEAIEKKVKQKAVSISEGWMNFLKGNCE
jgi:hypothetical protein